MNLSIPSSIYPLNWPLAQKHNVSFYIKRDDLIHPIISGNKWRKLKWNIEKVLSQDATGIVTFGGAYSNHLVAAAYMALVFNLQSHGIIRGIDCDLNNPTLKQASEFGMKFSKISRCDYKLKNTKWFLSKISHQFPFFCIIPEGGSNVQGALGCMEICHENLKEFRFDYIALPVGTATTMSGVVASAGSHTQVVGFSVLKQGSYLLLHIGELLKQLSHNNNANKFWSPAKSFHIEERFCGRGFGKVTPDLITFMNNFWHETGIALDPIYTGKMMFGIQQMLCEGEIKPKSRWLILHTGGLQGIKGVKGYLNKKGLILDYAYLYK